MCAARGLVHLEDKVEWRFHKAPVCTPPPSSHRTSAHVAHRVSGHVTKTHWVDAHGDVTYLAEK